MSSTLDAYHTIRVNIDAVKMFQPLIRDYLFEIDKVSDFIRYKPEASGILEASANKRFEDRENLCKEIYRQYEDIELSEAVKQNLERLKQENTFCLVTAHQLSLLGGPLYYAHKILSIIKMCESLNQQQQQFQYVPVFVLGSEDHDFEEVNHFHWRDQKVKWETNQGGAIGRYVIDEQAEQLIHGWCAELSDIETASFIKSIFKKGEQYSKVHRKWIHYLFESYGLIIVDFDSEYFKQTCADMFWDEIRNSRAKEVLNEHLKSMEARYALQAVPRDINIFELKQDSRTYAKKDLSGVAIKDLSPNVIYRPLMQQKGLPSVCYVGGGGELAYWLELKPLLEYNHIQFPVLCLRNHLVYGEMKTYLKMNQWELSSEDIFKQKEGLVQDWIMRHEGFTDTFETVRKNITQTLEPIKGEAEKLDATLMKAVAADMHQMDEILQKLEKKFIKASKRKHEDLLVFADKWKEQFFPQGTLMERHTSLMTYYDRYGKSWFDAVLKEIQPFSKDILFLYH